MNIILKCENYYKHNYLLRKHAFSIVYRTFSYTNHTVLPEALEKWKVDLFAKLLPRHLEIIFLVNFFFLKNVERQYPGDTEKLRILSIIDEGPPKSIRMANLVIFVFKCNFLVYHWFTLY